MLNRILFLLFSCLVVCGCSAETASPYPIYEADHAATGTEIYWLDNTRVLFMGFEGGKKPMNEEEQKRIKRAIYIWDTEKNTVEFYAYANSGLCYHEGYIRYILETESITKGEEDYYVDRRMTGEFGKEELIETIYPKDKNKIKRQDSAKKVVNHFTCKQVERPPEMYGRVMIPLLPEHGYLDFGVPEKNKSDYEKLATLVKPNNKKIEVNLPRKAISLQFKFYPFKRAYYGLQNGVPSRTEWRESNCLPAWLFWPDGKSKQECIPYGSWSAGGGELIVSMTKKAPFVKFMRIIKNKNSEEAGGYLLNGKEYIKVINDLIFNETVSPDGCKIAFVYAKNIEALRIGGKGQRTLKVIDVCD